MLQSIIEAFPNQPFVLLDGLDNAIIGVEPLSLRLIYSVSSIIETLMSGGMTGEEAEAWYAFNVATFPASGKAPILCDNTYFDDSFLNN